jgi:hypothetical protein
MSIVQSQACAWPLASWNYNEEMSMLKTKTRLLLIVLCAQSICLAQIEITLDRSYVSDGANRATITSDVHVVKTSAIHRAADEGDIHAAGTGTKIGMVAVAEVMNAKSERTHAVKQLTGSASSGQSVRITGAWRIWCEHGGEQQYVEGQAAPPLESSGQAHVFEIHPATKIYDTDVRHTWVPIDGFTYKEASNAFKTYERTRSEITFDAQTITISTEQAGDNYTEFLAQLLEDPHDLSDGESVFADIYDTQGELLVHKRRLIFVTGTPPEQVLRNKHKNDRIQVVGIPRFDLALVHYRVKQAEKHGVNANSVHWNLPYELIIGAVTDDDPQSPE